MPNIDQVQEILPYVATVVGAGFGSVLEASAIRTVADNRSSLVDVWGEAVELQTSKRWQKIGSKLIAPLVTVGALAGFANGVVWQDDPKAESQPTLLELVVDQSGATALGTGAAAQEITQIVSEITKNDKFDTNVVIAGNGQVRQVEIKDIKAFKPFGDAPLEQATLSAIDQANLSNTTDSVKNTRQNAGVLVVTNGNNIGFPLSIAEKAKSSNLPVYVANVESEGSNQATVEGLKAISKATNASYFEVNQNNIDNISRQIGNKLLPITPELPDRPDKLPHRVATAALSFLTLGVVFKGRRNMTLDNKILE